MPAVNERALVERCQRGDPSAFRQLVDARKDLVFALVARTLGDAARATRVRARFPDGTTREWTDIAANARVSLDASLDRPN